MAIKYDDSSISQLKGAERVRLRPEALLGSKGIDGARHTIYEIVGNASDEKLAGYGDSLDISLYEDGSVSVRDYGRGVPLGWNEKEQNWNYYLIYEELYAGGKYESYQDVLHQITDWSNFKITDVPYLFKVGLNGLGAAATQCTSEYFTVISYRDGISRRMDYKDGCHILDELIEEPTTEPNGTFVHWKPDKRVFSDVEIGSKWLDKLCKSLAYESGYNVNFNNKGHMKVYEASDIFEEMKKETGFVVKGSNFTHTEDKDGDVCICFADVALGGPGRGNEFFHNKVEVKGGVHAEAISAAQYYFLYEYFKSQGLKMQTSDYSGRLSFIVSALSNKVSYRGQTKDSLDDGYVYNCIYDCVMNIFKEEQVKGSVWLTNLIEDVRKNIENRMAVAELSKNLREVEKASRKGKASDKFRTCKTYGNDPTKTEFWIMEGDSAGNSFKYARDAIYQCFLTIRGKSLNVYKAPLEKLIANKEIKDIISVLGCGVDLGIDEYASFDISKLRVGKIILCSDADIDGKHIRMLLFLIMLRLFPQLLYDGYLYVALTPLHVIILKDDTPIYCFSDEEKDKKLEELGGVGAVKAITRFKGLGEVNADQLWNTTVNPETRKLFQIKIDRDDTDIYDVVECLFGKSTDRRKKIILGSMLGDDYDDIMGSVDEMVNYINSLDLTDLEYEDYEVAKA